MTFTTLTFVLFYAVVFAAYWIIGRRRAQNVLLLAASYFFYGWWDWRFCFLMLVSTSVDYFVGRAIEAAASTSHRRRLLLASVLFNLSLLGFFKYFNFFIDSLLSFAGALGLPLDPFTLRILLPVGISFYTFQTMSYTIDVYRRQLRPTTDFVAYAAYVSFFPQLVAGPIERGARFLPQFLAPRRFDRSAAVDGCRQVLWGFFKKMVIADNLAPVVNAAYAEPSSAAPGALVLGTVAFAFQIYCDFSAYSDIARGSARVLGFDLMRNFAYPYFAQSIGEFWRRWHISLSTWFRDYVFIPLGGSRRGRWRTWRNILLTFTVSGFWHGAEWTFVAWGFLNGILLCFSQAAGCELRRGAGDTPGGPGRLPGAATAGRMILTFTFTCALWVFFRAGSLAEAVSVFKIMFAQWPTVSEFAAAAAAGPLGGKIFLLVPAFVAVEWIQRRHFHALRMDSLPRPLRWMIYTALIWICVYWGTFATGDFIYFQF